jgi:hypothetical protein
MMQVPGAFAASMGRLLPSPSGGDALDGRAFEGHWGPLCPPSVGATTRDEQWSVCRDMIRGGSKGPRAHFTRATISACRLPQGQGSSRSFQSSSLWRFRLDLTSPRRYLSGTPRLGERRARHRPGRRFPTQISVQLAAEEDLVIFERNPRAWVRPQVIAATTAMTSKPKPMRRPQARSPPKVRARKPAPQSTQLGMSVVE